jgi:signal transduction histidine kinase
MKYVMEQRRTFYQAAPKGTDMNSLRAVHSVVASPIFDAQDQVIGALYGSRALTPRSRNLGSLEAQMIQVLSSTVSTSMVVTRQQEEATQLRIARDAAAEADKAKSRFLASMSHELRTPLNAIIGFTGTMLMKLPGPLNAEQEHQLRLVQTSGKHLLSIINDLLDLAKIESGRVQIALEPVDCRRVIEEVLQSLQPLAQDKGLELRVETFDGSVTATADRRALGQILINLVNNAIKFTNTGEVCVSLIPAADDHGPLRITVRDSGPGIPQADLARIFRAFERSTASAKAYDEGTGLGLHISQKLAELLNGTITVSSLVGEGSTFTISLAGP